MKCPECGTEDFMPEVGCFSCGYLLASQLPERQEAPPGEVVPPLHEALPTPGEGTPPLDGALPISDEELAYSDEDMVYPDEEMPLEQLNEMLTALGIDPLTGPRGAPKPVVETNPAETEPVVTGELLSPEAVESVSAARNNHEDVAERVTETVPEAHVETGVGINEGSTEKAEPETGDNQHTHGIPLTPPDKAPRKVLLAARYVAGPGQRLKTLFRNVSGWAAWISAFGRIVMRRIGAVVTRLVEGGKRRLGMLIPKKAEKAADEPEPETAAVSMDSSSTVPAETDVVLEESVLDSAAEQPEPETPPVAGIHADKELSPLMQQMTKRLFWVGIPVLAILLTVGLLVFVLALRESRQAALAQPAELPQADGYVPWTPAPDPEIEPFRVVGE